MDREKMRKILLIFPTVKLFPFESRIVHLPMGLAYIASYLEREGYKVRILDTVVANWKNPIQIGNMIHFGLAWQDILAEIKRAKPELVGISCLFSSQSEAFHAVAEKVKEYDRNVPVVAGGAHCSTLPNEVLEDKNIDAVVLGEGEQTFLDFIHYLEGRKALNELDGLAYRTEDGVRLIPKSRFISNLDSLPFPARHLLPFEEYSRAGVPYGRGFMRRPFASIITSRGCPFNCCFCSIHSVWGYTWRARSAENVLDEIVFLVEKYGVKELHFEDDNFCLNKKRANKICEGIIDRGIDIKWQTPNGIAVWTLDKTTLEKMKKSGCYQLSFGIESGCKDTLKFIGKPINLNYAKKVIAEANNLGIWTEGFFVFGFPYEDLASIAQSLNFAIESDLDFAVFSIATPYPKTKLYDVMKREGMIGDVNWDLLRTMSAAADTKYFTRDEISRLQRELFTNFFGSRMRRYLDLRSLLIRLKRIRSIDEVQFLLRLSKRAVQIMNKETLRTSTKDYYAVKTDISVRASRKLGER
jgi:anaerobic magnesium-protoporphyrin IX monomethyl ester cyclase